MGNRKPYHDDSGRPYERTLAERVECAHWMIADMASERRPPRMSIPAGNLLHCSTPGDEDIFLANLLDDQATRIAELDQQVERMSGALSRIFDIAAAVQVQPGNPWEALRLIEDVCPEVDGTTGKTTSGGDT